MDPAKVKITKLVGGSPNNKVAIPFNGQNGWSYDADPNNPHTVCVTQAPNPLDPHQPPACVNQQTGFVLHLNGTAQGFGDDTFAIEYKLVNGQDAPS